MSKESPTRYDNDQVKNYVKSVNWNKRLDREIPFLTKLFNDHEYKEICDFGCGPGMHANRLAKEKSFKVTGLDIDEHMIAYATELAKLQNLANLAFQQGNFFEYPAEQFKEKFDVLYTLGNALMIIWTNSEPTTVGEILKSLAYYIKSGGGLFFQILNSDAPRSGYVVSNISQNEVGENQIFVKHFLPVGEKLFTTFSTMKWKSDDTAMQVVDNRKGFLKLVPLKKLKSFLEEAGFMNFQFFENYNGDPLRQNESDSLMCFAQKK